MTPAESPLDQTQTPYADAVLRYRERGYIQFHTPGHKQGKGAPEKMREIFGLPLLGVDVAMAGGVEDVRESTHLVASAEKLAAAAWGGERCFFLVNGSTSGVHALLITLAGPGDSVIVPRNAHKSLHAALIFSGAWPVYVEPTVDPEWGIPLNVPSDRVAAAVAEHPEARALFCVSPSYNGLCADLPHLAELAHAVDMPFIVDQAWGPHLRFCDRLPVDAMTAGADAFVTSVHKLISGFTQSSVLLADAGRLNLGRLESIVKMTQSTSPLVLVYASIDTARWQMANHGQELWSRALDLAERARAEIDAIDGVRCLGHDVLEREGVYAFDPTRLTVSACGLGLSGFDLETRLRDDHGIAIEAADALNVVLNVTFGDSEDDLRRLVAALRGLAGGLGGGATGAAAQAACQALFVHLPRFTRQVMSPRDAFFAASDALPVRGCLGRASAEMVTPYPPGIPVVAPGEEVSDELIAYLEEGAAAGLHVHGPEDLTLRTLRVVR
jgi:lysine decarboxylase